jgi:hypothetical protein
MTKGPAPRPCESCPYRRDVPSGVWSPEDYQKLPLYDAPTSEQPLSAFQCHQNDRDSGKARLCAGWVGCHGDELLSLRLAVARGLADPDVFDYTTEVELFDSGSEAAAHGMKDIEDPGPEARALVLKIISVRSDVTVKEEKCPSSTSATECS